MNETEKIKFRLAANKEEYEKRVPCNFITLTLNDVNKIIDQKEIDESTKEKLKKMAKNYPFQALPTFVKNIDNKISEIRSKK